VENVFGSRRQEKTLPQKKKAERIGAVGRVQAQESGRGRKKVVRKEGLLLQ